MSRRPRLLLLLLVSAGALLLSCSNDEDNLRPPPASASIINVDFENARVIDVDSDHHQALLLHSGQGTPGTAVQLVDLSARNLVNSLILTDYADVYDIKFISDTLACFAGRLHDYRGYAVHFLSLPSLTLSTQVMITSDTSGHGGFLCVDSIRTFVYYSHAGGGIHDGIYKIRISNRHLVDADNDDQPPYAFDNELIPGAFDRPGKVFYNDAEGKIVVANPNFITIFDGSLWGTLSRPAVPPYPPVAHLATPSDTKADMMAFGADIYVFGGGSANQPTLSRFTVASVALEPPVPLTHRSWYDNNTAIAVHPRVDVVSVFVLREDSVGVGVGQYRLNNLVELAQSPYRTRVIPDTSISAFGLDIVSNKLIVADKHSPRLELIGIE